MKKYTPFFKGAIVVSLILINSTLFSQTAGDIAFVGFNADGNDDLALLTLSDVASETTIYITDNESDGLGGITSGEGTLTWTTGPKVIKAGTIVVFTDVNSASNPNYGVSIGTLSSSGSFSLPASSKDGIIAFLGTDHQTPITFLAAIQLGNDSTTLGAFDGDGITLTNTGLVIGSSIVVFDDSASPDGAVYNASRSSQASYANYYAMIADDSSNWSNVVNGDGETLLPFSQEAFTINSTNWTGATSAVWNLSGNWDNGIPTTSSLVTIPNVTTAPIISSGSEAKAGNLTIESGETLTINSGNLLTVSGLVTINGELFMNSSSSLIVSGSSTGNITYKRTLGTNNWYLISSPVSGETIEDLISNHTFATGTGSNIGIAPYINDGTNWDYQTNTSTGAMTSGKGYSMKLNTAGNLSFTGTMPLTDIGIAITSNTTAFNLVGNPYPSYLAATNTANASYNILKLNDTDNDYLTEATLWFWNQGTNSYDQINHASGSFYIAPGQGFFISANGSQTFSVTEAMQDHQTNDSFQKRNSSSHPKIKLFVTDGFLTRKSMVYYIDGTSTGFDNGYDSSIFSEGDNSFALYTHTVANENSKDLGIQSLPNSNHETMIIPIGVNAESGKQLTFSAEVLNLPSGFHVYLEDKETDTFTQIDNLNPYQITLSNTLNGVGRFYMHTTANTLSTNPTNPNKISCLTIGKTLRISGISESTMLSLYNIMGKEVIRHQLKDRKVNNVDLSSVKTGIYIVQITSKNRTMSKKVVLQ